MPPLEPPPELVLLDVTLRRNGDEKRWLIASWEHGWHCRIIERHRVTLSNCHTKALALDQKFAWEVEIAAARADGWS